MTYVRETCGCCGEWTIASPQGRGVTTRGMEKRGSPETASYLRSSLEGALPHELPFALNCQHGRLFAALHSTAPCRGGSAGSPSLLTLVPAHN